MSKFSVKLGSQYTSHKTLSLKAKLFLATCGVLFFGEYLVYYITLYQCSWPKLNNSQSDPSDQLRMMILADTHLLGPIQGHWFDKLRREWQMYRAFQTSIALNQPEAVVFLGDLFDEGLWISEESFNKHVDRFNSMFFVPEGTARFVVAGNHDMGFHYRISPYLQRRFTMAFDAPSVKLVTLKGSHFILLNSMALEGDGCFLCRPAELKIAALSRCLKNAEGLSESCPESMKLDSYSRPIILQHFPLYRQSDRVCKEPDSAPEDEKTLAFREKWDCLSKESSKLLLKSLKPRLVVTGHTHHGCRRYHKKFDTHEMTVASFSWRNKDNPSFLLAVISPDAWAIRKCHMPQESRVILFYVLCVALTVVYVFLQSRHRWGFCRASLAKGEKIP